MANALAVGGLQHPQIDTMGAFAQGVNARQTTENNQLEIARKGMETIGSIALGSMGGKLDGEVNPEQFEQGLDMLAAQGINVDEFRGKPEIAPIVARSSLTALQQLQTAQNQQQLDLALKKFQHDVQTGVNSVKRSLNTIPGVDAQGNPVLLQTGDDGTAVQTQIPEGVTISKEPIKVDLGTEWAFLDPITRQVIKTLPKENEQAAYDTAFGSAAGKAAAERIDQLPGAIAKADNMIATIDGILNDPALDVSTGWLSWMQAVHGTDQYRFGQRALQLQGQAFLQAFESLKGGGQITEVEGNKATQAIGRLSTAQKPEDYRAAMDELKTIIVEARARAQTAAGAAPDASSAPAPVTTGTKRTTANGIEYEIGD